MYLIKIRLKVSDSAGSALETKVQPATFSRMLQLEEDGLLDVLECTYIP